ncbi:hypothetical protein CPC08DRAFT_559343 [Agrocybe pediades]|nr:hypothetical protein CPC08DRAFT_559343 [Agrocybe pediades]
MNFTVITLYERGGGKAAKHCLVFETSSIGSLSYISVQIWQFHRQKRFRAQCCQTAKLNSPRFAHLPAAACLYLIPNTCVKDVNNAEYLELSEALFRDVYTPIASQKPALIRVVKKLLETGKGKGKTATGDGDGDQE